MHREIDVPLVEYQTGGSHVGLADAIRPTLPATDCKKVWEVHLY